MKPTVFRYKSASSDEWQYTDRSDESYLKECGARDVGIVEKPPLDWVECRIKTITALIPCISESKETLAYYQELLRYYVNYLKPKEDVNTEINISSDFDPWDQYGLSSPDEKEALLQKGVRAKLAEKAIYPMKDGVFSQIFSVSVKANGLSGNEVVDSLVRAIVERLALLGGTKAVVHVRADDQFCYPGFGFYAKIYWI